MSGVRLNWFETVGNRLRVLVRRRVAQAVEDRPDENEAVSDLTQEAMAIAAERIDEFRGTTEAELVAWVCAIAETKLCDHRRTARRQRRDVRRTRSLDPIGDDMPDEADRPDNALLRTEEREFVRRLIDRLPAVERTAIRVRYIEERPVAEVASRLYRSEAAAQGVLKRALVRLREHARSRPVVPAGAIELESVKNGPAGDA